MRHDARAFLSDIIEHGEAAERFLRGKSLADYLGDELLRAAVERKLFIVGEAVAQLYRRFPESAAELGDVSPIIGFRNVLAHGYDAIDDRTIWSIATDSLPVLLSTARRLT